MIVSLQSQWKTKEGLVISPSFLIQSCFYGITLCTPDGRSLSNETITFYIKAAQSTVERLLNVKLNKELIIEDLSFYTDDWKNWGNVTTTYPVVQAFEMNGYINTTQQIIYPKDWLSVRKTSDGKLYQRQIFTIPAGNATGLSQSVVFSGTSPHLWFLRMGQIPNYWRVVYGTGFDKVPDDIIQAILYLAAIPIYMWLGNAIIQPGLSSYSIGLDGLSQSKSIEAGGFTTRIKQLQDQLGTLDPQSSGLLKTLKEYYNGMTLTVC